MAVKNNWLVASMMALFLAGMLYSCDNSDHSSHMDCSRRGEPMKQQRDGSWKCD